MSLKQGIIDKIIAIEGGYVNDPKDSGGETNFGITKKVAKAYGYKGEMQELPRSLAFEIYSKKYWDALMLDKIQEVSFRIAKELADTGVNMGTKRAAKFFQRSLNSLNNCGNYYSDLVVDGAVGRKTIRALEIFINFRGSDGEEVILKMLDCLQGIFYIELAEKREKDEKFIYGWFKNRIGTK